MTLADGGYNIDDGTTCGFTAGNNSLPSTNPKLEPGGPRDNGGPTKTIALRSDSPAIDAISNGTNGCGTVTTDQRGVSRPQNSSCDIGAFELARARPESVSWKCTRSCRRFRDCWPPGSKSLTRRSAVVHPLHKQEARLPGVVECLIINLRGQIRKRCAARTPSAYLSILPRSTYGTQRSHPADPLFLLST